MKKRTKELAASLLLSGLSLAGGPASAAEFEVLDRLSVDGYSVFRGSVAVPGGGFAVGGSTFVVKNGNVGIGTTSPMSGLHVISSNGGSSANWYDPQNYAATAHQDSNAGQKYGLLVSDRWRNAENYLFAVDGRYTNGGGSVSEDTHNPYFIVRGDGNVGIGTTAPAAKLQVLYPSAAPSFDPQYAGLNLHGNSSVRLLFGTDPVSPYSAWLQTSNTGSPFPLSLNPLGGNVGIGTAAPYAKLSVIGTVLTETSASNIPNLLFGSPGLNYGQIQNDSTGVWSLGYGATNASKGTAVFTWNTGGNVGIGTTGPGNLLHLVKSVDTEADLLKLENISTANNTTKSVGMVFSGKDTVGSTKDAAKILAVPRTVNWERGDLAFYTYKEPGGQAEAMRIDYSGNVGIGTTAPAALLEIKGGAADGATMLLRNNNNNYWDLWNDNGSNSLNIQYGGATKMIVQSGGEVGIGTANPAAKLEIKGGATGELRLPLSINSGYYLPGSAIGIGFQTDGSASYTKGALVYSSNGSGWNIGNFYFLLRNDGNFNLVTLADAKMVILAGGNVGIGTTNPGATFQVGTSGGGQTTLANSWGTFSSIRYKDDVRTLPAALDKIGRLRGVEFKWKSSGKDDIGIIAEEVAKIFPEIVQYEKNGKDAKGVDYSKLIAPLIEAIKEQQREIEILKARLSEVERR